MDPPLRCSGWDASGWTAGISLPGYRIVIRLTQVSKPFKSIQSVELDEIPLARFDYILTNKETSRRQKINVLFT